VLTYIAKVITPFIDYVIDGIIVNQLVWPQRMVVGGGAAGAGAAAAAAAASFAGCG